MSQTFITLTGERKKQVLKELMQGVEWYAYNRRVDTLHPINTLEMTVVENFAGTYYLALSEIHGYFDETTTYTSSFTCSVSTLISDATGEKVLFVRPPQILYKPKEPFFNENTVIVFRGKEGYQTISLPGNFSYNDYVTDPLSVIDDDVVQIYEWPGRYDYLTKEQMELFGVSRSDVIPFFSFDVSNMNG